MWTEEFLITTKVLQCLVKKDKEENHENNRIFELLQRIEL